MPVCDRAQVHVVRGRLAADQPHQRERAGIEAGEHHHLGPGPAQSRNGRIERLGERVGIGARPEQVVAACRDADQVGHHGNGERHLLGGDLPHQLAANREVRVAKLPGWPAASRSANLSAQPRQLQALKPKPW